MSHWHRLLDRAITGLARLQGAAVTIEDWTLGGGTALMLHHRHRMSKDIDIFFGDPQYLPFLSPRLGGEDIWNADAYDEAAHYLKLRYPEGEIDFIASAAITDLLPYPFEVPADETAGIPAYRFRIEHSVEIAMKKLWYRGSELKVRDVFDLAVVWQHHAPLLRSNLPRVAAKSIQIRDCLERMRPDFFQAEIQAMDVLAAYEPLGANALDLVKEIAEQIRER